MLLGIIADDDTDIETIPEVKHLQWTENVVFFDVETTGLARTSEIVQLSAVHEDNAFNR